MVEFWNDHGLHLWFGQCSKFDPCQRRLNSPWHGGHTLSYSAPDRHPHPHHPHPHLLQSLEPQIYLKTPVFGPSQIWGPKSPKKNAFHEQYMATSWNAGISLIQTARILPGSTASHSSYHWPTVSLLLQEYSSCYRTSIFWLKSTVFKLPHMFSWHYRVPKKKCTNTNLQIQKIQPTATKNRMLLPHPAVKLQGGHRTLILWRGVFASPLGLASPQLDHIEARKAVSPWFARGSSRENWEWSAEITT